MYLNLEQYVKKRLAQRFRIRCNTIEKLYLSSFHWLNCSIYYIFIERTNFEKAFLLLCTVVWNCNACDYDYAPVRTSQVADAIYSGPGDTRMCCTSLQLWSPGACVQTWEPYYYLGSQMRFHPIYIYSENVSRDAKSCSPIHLPSFWSQMHPHIHAQKHNYKNTTSCDGNNCMILKYLSLHSFITRVSFSVARNLLCLNLITWSPGEANLDPFYYHA